MHRLCAEIRQKRIELWKNQSRILHQDTTPAYTSMLEREFLAKNKTVIMSQPPYSPDLAPANFFLFPKLKTPMKGKRFATIEELKEKSKQGLLHTYIIGHNNPSVRIIDLVSYTTYVVWVNFIHKWRNLQFKVRTTDFLRNFSWQLLFTLRGLARNLLRGNRRRNTFRISF